MRGKLLATLVIHEPGIKLKIYREGAGYVVRGLGADQSNADPCSDWAELGGYLAGAIDPPEDAAF